MEVFRKPLRRTDITKRLAVPTRSLKHLPGFKGKHYFQVKVKHTSCPEPSVLWCYRRKKGKYRKPAFSKGWIEIARRQELRVGDIVFLVREDDHVAGASFKLAVKRKINILGKEIWADVI